MLVDRDCLKPGNLRGHVCGPETIDQPKSQAVYAWLRGHFPKLTADAHNLCFLTRSGELRDLICQRDAVMVVVDEEGPKHLIDAMADVLRRPHRSTGISSYIRAGFPNSLWRRPLKQQGDCEGPSAGNRHKSFMKQHLDFSTAFKLPFCPFSRQGLATFSGICWATDFLHPHTLPRVCKKSTLEIGISRQFQGFHRPKKGQKSN